MIRLIGVLTGAALATGLLLLVLGVPELGGQPAAEQDSASESAIVIPTPREPLMPPETTPEEPAMEEPAPLAGSDSTPETGTTAETPLAAEAKRRMTMLDDPVPEPDTANSITLPSDEAPTENWYAFWSPFRSRIAADGFVSELSRTTGLDYRVVKLKPGVYEVAVAYTDDADIENKLTRISAATGLDMSGG